MTDVKKAAFVGTTCVSTYIANYYLRHILSVLTPTLLETGLFPLEQIATLSSTYMLLYALGQLANGFLGDIFSPKNMVGIGLFVSGGAMLLFPFIASSVLQVLCFAVFGFGLSMLRGPLMKIISENTKPSHARLICVFFSFASFAGPLLASLFAMINGWRYAFLAAGGVALLLGAVAYLVFSVLEKRGLISYMKTEVKGLSSILAVFKIENIVFYIIVACLVEIAAAAISQWITTFLTAALGFPRDTANLLYTGISTLRSFMPFLALAIFRAIKERDLPMMRATFSVSSVAFLLLLLSPNKWCSLVLLALALMAMSCTSALLWSIYIPSLGKTGRVSSVNGTIDCLGYAAAASANLLFAGVMGGANWNTVYILWGSIGIIGLLATFLYKKPKTEA